MQRFSIGRRLSQRWMLLVAVAVLALAGFTVYRLHGIFASHDVTSTPSGSENDIVPFNPKHVVMEVFGPPGTVASPHRRRPAGAGTRGRVHHGHICRAVGAG